MIKFLIAVTLLLLFACFVMSRQKDPDCSGLIPVQFIFKTLSGDVSVSYIGHLCKSAAEKVPDSTDIILTDLPDSPVTCVCRSCLRKRGWIKIAYQPKTIYQAADIERRARAELASGSVTIKDPVDIAVSVESNTQIPASCADALDCTTRFASEGCNNRSMLTDCSVSCNSCGININALALPKSASCSKSEETEIDQLN